MATFATPTAGSPLTLRFDDEMQSHIRKRAAKDIVKQDNGRRRDGSGNRSEQQPGQESVVFDSSDEFDDRQRHRLIEGYELHQGIYRCLIQSGRSSV